MTDEQICRKISESLEPKPNWYPGDQIQMPQSEAWYFDFLGTGEWKPLRWFTDPAARYLLVRKILEQERTITIAWLPDRQVFSLHIGKGRSKHEFHIYDTYDRIWPLAYLKTITAAKEKA